MANHPEKTGHNTGRNTGHKSTVEERMRRIGSFITPSPKLSGNPTGEKKRPAIQRESTSNAAIRAQERKAAGISNKPTKKQSRIINILKRLGLKK